MPISAYKLFTKRELAHIQIQLDKLVKQWAQSWLAEADNSFAVTVDACEQFGDGDLTGPDAMWFVTSTDDDHWVAVAPQGASVNVLRGLFGEDFIGNDDVSENDFPLAFGLCEKLSYDLADCVLQQAPPDMDRHVRVHHVRRTLAQRIWRRGSAAVCVLISVGDEKTHLVMSPEIVIGYLSSLTSKHIELKPLTSVNKAIHPTKVRLEVTAGTAVLSIAELRSIVVGDTVRLDTKLDQPIAVMLGGKRICSAFLGAHDGRRAVMLMSSR